MTDDYTYDKAVTEGRREAIEGVPLSPQAHDEPWAVFQTRQKAYEWTKRRSEAK